MGVGEGFPLVGLAAGAALAPVPWPLGTDAVCGVPAAAVSCDTRATSGCGSGDGWLDAILLAGGGSPGGGAGLLTEAGGLGGDGAGLLTGWTRSGGSACAFDPGGVSITGADCEALGEGAFSGILPIAPCADVFGTAGGSACAGRLGVSCGTGRRCRCMQQCLNLRPLPQAQGAFREAGRGNRLPGEPSPRCAAGGRGWFLRKPGADSAALSIAWVRWLGMGVGARPADRDDLGSPGDSAARAGCVGRGGGELRIEGEFRAGDELCAEGALRAGSFARAAVARVEDFSVLISSSTRCRFRSAASSD